MDSKTLFLKGVSIQSIITLLMGALELVVFAVMSRLLSKAEFGYYAAIVGILAIFTSITEAGFGAAIIQRNNAKQNYINTAFSLCWISGIIGTIVLFLSAPFIARTIADDTITNPLRIMSLNVFLACSASVGKSLLIKDLRFKTYGTYEFCSYFISSALGITLALLGFGLYSIVSISVSNLLLINIILYTKSVQLPRFAIDRSEVKNIFSFGGWLTLSVIVNMITQQLDKLLLPKWLSVEALGAYNRPAGFINTFTGKINGIFDTVLFPMLSSIQNEGSKVSSVLLQAVSILNSFSVTLFCVFFFNASLIISIFFGADWLSLIGVFQIISIYIIFNIDNRLVDCFFRSLGLVKLGFYLRLLSAFLTLGCIYFGCRLGIKGIAAAIVSANFITVFIKLTALSIKTRTSFGHLIKSFLLSLKASLPLIMEGLLFAFLCSQPSLFIQLVFLFIMGITIAVEFFVFPKFIGKDYYDSVYSIIAPTILRIIKKRN